MPTMTLDLSEAALTNLGAQARRHERSPAAEAQAVLEESLRRRRSRRPVARAEPEERAPGSGGEGNAVIATLPVPESYKRDLRRAVAFLRELGCAEIHLFGSVRDGAIHDESDIDLAVRGCPKRKFFYVLARLRRALEHPVDLLDLDQDCPFVRHLVENGGLLRIG